MMKNTSEGAFLSHPHSLRATAITLWSNAGVPNKHIMAISGHRNEQSLALPSAAPRATLMHFFVLSKLPARIYNSTYAR